MSDKISTFFISVGEPSGDIHAAKLVLSLKKISPNIKFIGMVGQNDRGGRRCKKPYRHHVSNGLCRSIKKLQ